MAKIVIMDHPLIKHKIGLIRRKEIGTKEFRESSAMKRPGIWSSRMLILRHPSARQLCRRSRERSSLSFRSSGQVLEWLTEC